MEYGFTTAAYVVAAVLFILSLGGLSGQESAKRAVWYGIVGMALAVFATLIGPGGGLWRPVAATPEPGLRRPGPGLGGIWRESQFFCFHECQRPGRRSTEF